MILTLDQISVSFDGFKALNDLTLAIPERSLHAVIGPNGAGKTTMMDVITGKTRPDAGTVTFKGESLIGLREADIAQRGIGRKFQRPSVFEAQTVQENLALSVQGKRGIWPMLFTQQSVETREKLDAILERIRLAERQHDLAGSLSHGQKQWLEIGMLLAQNPDLLLVDEPVAGMTDTETELTAELLVELAKDHTIVVVEHDMDFVRALNAPVTVLHAGQVLADGSIDSVSEHPDVREVYLGR